MPKIQTTTIYSKVDDAIRKGFTTISAQGSSRSSKTYNILIWLINYCLQHPYTRLSICRKTLPALKKSVFVDFKEILINMSIFDPKRLNKTEMIYEFANGSWAELFSVDDEQKLRGSKRHVLYVNEGNELSFIEWQQLKMRTTRFAIVDYNPSFSDDHWLCELNKDKRTHHFISTYKDNPFLEQTIVDEIESLQHKNKSLWQIYGLGLQSQIEGLVFKDIEIVDQVPLWIKKTWIGLDFGYTNDPTAAIGVSMLDDDLYLDELFYRTHMLSGDIIKALKPYDHLKIISESADPRLVKEIRNSGLKIFPVDKFKGSIMAGLNKMLEYNIKITKNSTNLIKEFKNYTYLQDKDEKWLNEPIDAYNHGIDASRYVILEEVLGKNSTVQDLSGIFGR